MANDKLPPILPDQRAVFVGRTGSGKTYLAKALLSNVDRLIVYDPKGTLGEESGWNLEPYDPAKSPQIMVDPKSKFRYRVLTPLDGNWEPYIWPVYYAHNITVYIDEVYGVETGTKPLLATQAIITRGRELGIGVWSATQRPSGIPLIYITEVDWIFEFQLRLDEDKKRIALMMGPAAMRSLRGHQVIVYNDTMDEPRFFSKGAKVVKHDELADSGAPVEKSAFPKRTRNNPKRTRDKFGGGPLRGSFAETRK